MIKLKDIIKEDFGGPGKAVYPSNHKAGMKVTKGGSMCANCKYYYVSDGPKCDNAHWNKWSQTTLIPAPADEYCCDWWEPNKD